MIFGSYDKWVGPCIANHFCWLVVINELLAYTLTSVIFFPFIVHAKVFVEIFLYLTKKRFFAL